MDSDIKLFRITDYAVALHIIMHPALKAVLSEDGGDFGMPNIVDEYWMGAEVSGKVAGCFRICPQGKTIYQIHTYFIPGFRKYADDLGDKISLWAIENLPDFNSFSCMVPVCFENVLRHVDRKGFNRVGTLKEAYFYKDKLVDIAIFQINKKEIMREINGRL